MGMVHLRSIVALIYEGSFPYLNSLRALQIPAWTVMKTPIEAIAM